MSRLYISFAMCVAVAALGGCGGEATSSEGPRTGGALTIAQTSNPDFLDPAKGYTVEASAAHWLIYPGLVTYRHEEGEEGSKLIPAAAEALPKVSPDGRTYTFRLRKGLIYGDGTPARAADFERSIQRSLTLQWGGLSFFSGIVGVDEYVERAKPGADIPGITSDDRSGEITIELTEPDGRLMNILAFPAAGLVPADTPLEDLSRKPPPGLGAYNFGTIEPNRQYELVRNRNFALPGIPKGSADRITVKLVKSSQRQVQDVIRGRLDWILDEPPADLLPEIRSKYGDRFEENTANSTYYQFFNVETEPFDDPKVRAAVNHALDKRALVRIFGGLLEPDCNFLPPGMVGYERIDPCPYGDPEQPPDVERARMLIREAGAEGAPVTVWGTDEERSVKVTEFYADVLNGIGLKAKPRIVGAETYYAAIGNVETEAQTGFFAWFQDFPHPANFFFLLSAESVQDTDSVNPGRVSDPEVNRRYEALKREPLEENADEWSALDRLVTSPEKALVAAYGHTKDTTFVSERMNFEDCTVYHPVYRDDWSQFCLK